MGSPPAHRQQNHKLHRPVALHGLQQSIQNLEIFIFRFQLQILFQRSRRRIEIAELVIHERQVEINQRESRLDLRRSFVVKFCQLHIAGIVIKVREIVVGFDVPRIIFE